MKHTKMSLREMAAQTPPEVQQEVKMEFAVSNRIYELMISKGLNQKQLAIALGKRPCEVNKWISGQHNFTLRTIAMLTTFFGEPIIGVAE